LFLPELDDRVATPPPSFDPPELGDGEEPPEEELPEDEPPDGTAVPLDVAPAGAVCCAPAADAVTIAIIPVRAAAITERFIPSSSSLPILL